MAKPSSILARTWALLATPVILATFIGMARWSRLFADGTKLSITPWYSGGEVAQSLEHGTYRTLLRRPVFDGLIGQRSTGFVQIEWIPAEGVSLPASIRESVDCDGDGSTDFVVQLAPAQNQATVHALSSRVLGLERFFDLGREKVVRVRLKRKR